MDAKLLRATHDGTYKAMQEMSHQEPGSSELHAKRGCEKAVHKRYRELCEIDDEATRRGGWDNLNRYDLKRARKREAGTSVAVKAPGPIAWHGTARDFGDAIFKLHKNGLIPGKQWADALRILSPHFVDKKGKEFKPDSIIESIRDRKRREEKGGPGEKLKLD